MKVREGGRGRGMMIGWTNKRDVVRQEGGKEIKIQMELRKRRNYFSFHF